MTISTIIPVYNVAPYIEDCLRSVMRQTYRGSMECLIVDDGCTDDSMVIAERMIAEYEGPIQFRILHHEENRGLSAARNTGTLQAKGEYLYYIDSDDEITEDCIEKLMAVASQDPSIEMVQGNALVHFLDGRAEALVKETVLPLTKTNDEARSCFYQFKQISFSAWNKLLKRNFIIQNDLLCKEGIIYEDILWTFHLLKFLQKAAFVPDVTYHYKKRNYSITTSTDIRTKYNSFSIICQDVLTHLTPGYEHEELSGYSIIISERCCLLAYNEPSFEKIIQLCREKSKQYGSRSLRLKLTAIYYLGKFRYGWVVMALLKRIKHPGLVRRDIHRLWR